MRALLPLCFDVVACASRAPAIAADLIPLDIVCLGIRSVPCASGNDVVHTGSPEPRA